MQNVQHIILHDKFTEFNTKIQPYIHTSVNANLADWLHDQTVIQNYEDV